MKRKKSPKTTGSPSFASPEIAQIEQLLQFMTEHNLEEFEYSRGDLRIRLRKPAQGMYLAGPRPGVPEIIVAGEPHAGSAQPVSGPGSGHGASPHGGGGSPEGRSTEDLHLVKSPIVGTYYESPSPGTEAFVKVGAQVDTGQTLCIVEAMKLMNEIESDASGEIVKIFVENGQPVEYGQPLFGIRPGRKR
ncbi:MAG: acetyl-CoA carboxylase biotin carboxyl carrier protein [Candidatus Acidiferrum sp.]|jgi:acetyl-CoA carboxylase biotin carboxyl carrier protein